MTTTPEGVGAPTPTFGYICMYRDQRIETRAATTYEAQVKTAEWFRKKFPRRKIRDWEINVALAELPDGTAYVHTAVD